ncbi:MAG: collagen-like protein [Gemmatimonadetes bacterium]|nr:collagen-like protein [Gemmatimonadota bacterium]
MLPKYILPFIALTMLTFALGACEGPMGPEGPRGARGVQGEKGEPGFPEYTLIEITLGSSFYNDELERYIIRDERIGLETVINVYFVKFYRNTRTPYYESLSMIDDDVRYWVDEGRLHIYDRREELAGETIVVLVTGD